MTQPTTPTHSTRDRILDAAEALYAEHGVHATSLRAITREATVNLAAVNYHFGTKDNLTQAVFARRLGPLNVERLARLDAAFERAAPATPPVEDIIESFVVPPLHLAADRAAGGERFVRLMGRMYSEPSADLHHLVARQFEEVFRRYTAALATALPDLTPGEVIWRLHFLIGAMVHTMADPAKISEFTGGLCDSTDRCSVARRLVEFAAAGFRAPPLAEEGR